MTIAPYDLVIGSGKHECLVAQYGTAMGLSTPVSKIEGTIAKMTSEV
jgi:hypothetical protein